MIRQRGFTLIEISIVLVIIGLLVGGLIVGKNLIQVAQINNQVREVEKYKTAMFAFRAKYGCIAGDCPSATALGLGTNGNGDGNVCFYCGGQGSQEYIKVWKHLSAAELLDEPYTGTVDGSGSYYGQSAGINIPMTKIGKGGVQYGANFFGSWSVHNFDIGGWRSDGNHLADLLTTDEARAIDLKLDDGKPNTGKVIGSSLVLQNTSTSNQTCRPNEGTNVYWSRGSGPLCYLRFEFNP